MTSNYFETHLSALFAHVDATAESAAADFPLINAPDGLTESDVAFYRDDAALMLEAQGLFLEAVAARYRRALARAVNARLFAEKV
jgi:hypothetical protein